VGHNLNKWDSKEPRFDKRDLARSVALFGQMDKGNPKNAGDRLVAPTQIRLSRSKEK
jgi:hypothetical protein